MENIHNNQGLFKDVKRDLGIFADDLSAVKNEAKKDLKEASSFTRMATIGSVALIGCHEVGMEFMLGRVGVWSFEHWNNPFITAGSMTTSSLIVEGALTLGVSYSLAKNHRVSEEMGQRFNLNNDDGNIDKKNTSIKNKLIDAADTAGLALGLGSPGVIVRNHARNNEKSFKDDLKTGSIAIGALAVSNYFVGLIASGGLWFSKSLFDTNVVSDITLPVLKSPFTYIGLFAVTRSLAYANKRKERYKAADDNTNIKQGEQDYGKRI